MISSGGIALTQVQQLAALAGIWRAFSGPTNEQLAAGGANELGQLYGKWGASVDPAALQKTAEKLPRAKSETLIRTPIVMNMECGCKKRGQIISKGEIVNIMWDEIEHGHKAIPSQRVK